jgi:branched-subunit amino acid aminotransferase/4-amino-4-deoxychorismate lyase
VSAAPPRGVFETIRVRNGQAPLLSGHAARFAAACQALGLPLPEESLERLVAPWFGAGDLIVRVETGLRGGATVTTRPVPPLTPLAVIVAPTRHVPYPFKVTERSAFVAAQSEARAAGADDALLVTASGLVAEGTVWSIFWWEGDRLTTPPLALGVLPGVGRARALDLEPVVERERTPAELARRSAFALNAVRGVVPITHLAGEQLPDDPRTARLAERFWPA